MEGKFLEIFVFCNDISGLCVYRILLQMDNFMQTKIYYKSKCTNRSCAIYLEDKNCDTRDLEYYSNSITYGISRMEECL